MNGAIGSITGCPAIAGMSGQLQQRMAAAVLEGEPDHPSSIEEFGLRHLKTPEEIAEILYLREAIDLSVHARAPANFLTLEKKETSAVLWVPSNCAGKS